MAGTKANPSGKKGTKVASKKKASKVKTKVEVRTAYSTFAEQTRILDLEKEGLVIKQVVPFKDSGKDEVDVVLSIWELQPKGGTDRGKPFEIVQLIGNVSKKNKHRFEVTESKPNEEKCPKRRNAKKTDLWLSGKITVLDPDGRTVPGGKDLDVVIPPLEYDETLELQLGCRVGPETEASAVCGQAKVTWGSLEKVLKDLKVSDHTGGMNTMGDQAGRLEKIVVHCMCAINVITDKSSAKKYNECFDFAKNHEILKDNKVSAHFVIDREGTIHHLVETNKIAIHAGSTNNTRGIGIELLGFADDWREQEEERYADLKKDHKTQVEYRGKIQAALDKHKKSKAAKEKMVNVGGKDISVDVAITRCENAIKKLDKAIKKLKVKLDGYEEWTKDKDAGGRPLVYCYTDKQYDSLCEMLDVFGKRYGYLKVLSHQSISPSTRKDPGEYFDWDKILPHLLPGTKKGSVDKGIYYLVD